MSRPTLGHDQHLGDMSPSLTQNTSRRLSRVSFVFGLIPIQSLSVHELHIHTSHCGSRHSQNISHSTCIISRSYNKFIHPKFIMKLRYVQPKNHIQTLLAYISKYTLNTYITSIQYKQKTSKGRTLPMAIWIIKTSLRHLGFDVQNMPLEKKGSPKYKYNYWEA